MTKIILTIGQNHTYHSHECKVYTLPCVYFPLLYTTSHITTILTIFCKFQFSPACIPLQLWYCVPVVYQLCTVLFKASNGSEVGLIMVWHIEKNIVKTMQSIFPK
uniref:AlNc14C69G4792 protein n=1 Tax=Albugo laibachii Nc14 TaxID=890382 RepID=F0WDS4_9STRA|nr:AlNc14C69G4792 [Albugo laibachii Nc14]|eukprot:CCA19351.1 AlNc14C69G4792 [Albugo laibachii Nc14]